MRIPAFPIPLLLFASRNGAAENAVTVDTEAVVSGETLPDNCEHSGSSANGGFSFIFTCPQRSESPDGKYALTIDDYRYEDGEEVYRLYATDNADRREFDIAELNDAFPFVLFWSPRPGWFAVEHYRGSGLAEVKVFEIASDGVRERDSFNISAHSAYAGKFPCLAPFDGGSNRGRIQGWSADGRHLAWTMMTRLDVCMEVGEIGPVPLEKQVFPVSVISDLDTGEVVEGSVRVLDWDNLTMPKDGRYAQIVRAGE